MVYDLVVDDGRDRIFRIDGNTVITSVFNESECLFFKLPEEISDKAREAIVEEVRKATTVIKKPIIFLPHFVERLRPVAPTAVTQMETLCPVCGAGKIQRTDGSFVCPIHGV